VAIRFRAGSIALGERGGAVGDPAGAGECPAGGQPGGEREEREQDGCDVHAGILTRGSDSFRQ
jgi:hypothetical protein